MSIGIPRRGYVGLRETAARLFDSRRGGTDLKLLARDLLVGFHDVCTFAGLDGVLGELAGAFAPLEGADRSALADHEAVSAALVARLRTLDLDPNSGGPRNAKPGQLADSVVAVLDLTIVETPDDSISLGDDVRVAVTGALASVLDLEMAAPTMRESIIADARARCDESFHAAFDKIAAALDERALQQVKQPKVPVHALHAVQRGAVRGARCVRRPGCERRDRSSSGGARSGRLPGNRGRGPDRTPGHLPYDRARRGDPSRQRQPRSQDPVRAGSFVARQPDDARADLVARRGEAGQALCREPDVCGRRCHRAPEVRPRLGRIEPRAADRRRVRYRQVHAHSRPAATLAAAVPAHGASGCGVQLRTVAVNPGDAS